MKFHHILKKHMRVWINYLDKKLVANRNALYSAVLNISFKTTALSSTKFISRSHGRINDVSVDLTENSNRLLSFALKNSVECKYPATYNC